MDYNQDDNYNDSYYEEYSNNGNNQNNKKGIGIIIVLAIILLFLIIIFLYQKFGNRLDIKVPGKEPEEDKIELVLLGDETVYLALNGTYSDSGFELMINGENRNDLVTVENDLDTNTLGSYKYTYTYNDKKIERDIIVSDFKEYYTVSYNEEVTDKDLDVDINIDKDKIEKITINDEDYSEELNKITIKESGVYSLSIYDKYSNTIIVPIKIDNIDKVALAASCRLTYSSTGTVVKVKTNKPISYVNYDSKKSELLTYTYSSIKRNPIIEVYDKNNNKVTLKKCTDTNEYSEKLQIHFINSSHNDDAILIRTDYKTILIDTGRNSSASKVVNYIKATGVTKIDYLIGSHLDYNHVQGHATILQNFTVGKIIYPDDIFNCYKNKSCEKDSAKYLVDELNKQKKTPEILKAGDKFTVGELQFLIFSPFKIVKKGNSGNDNSFIFKMIFRNNTFLFTGDATDTTMNITELNKYASNLGTTLKSDFFKYPHHGTRSLPKEFAKAVSPTIVAVTNIGGSSPSSSNIKYLNNPTVYQQRKSKTGNIYFESDGKKITATMDVSASSYKKSVSTLNSGIYTETAIK